MKNKGKVSKLLKVLSIFLIIGVVITTSLVVYADNVTSTLSGSIVRLHVIANSNTPEDQGLKLKVRDKIVEYMKDELQTSQSAGESMERINNDLPEIEKIALDVITEEGSSYPVKASVGRSAFPMKNYGDVTLPAGNYQALKVVIGSGSGQNWWCVLFPPLCFVDTQSAVVTDDGKKLLQDELPEGSYNLITSGDNGDVKVKAKFKIVDIVESSKNKIQSAIASWFK
ncbi:MAG: stage II sporulation protein R [Clostridiales bacterium]|jgi:stage II sporulation protein R|nr:stage II sporulation protein R [Clostridiales bacterium]